MLGQVEIGPVGHAPQFTPPKGETELEVGRRLGIVGQLLFFVIPELEVFVPHSQGQQPLMAGVFPILEPLEVGARLAEEFELHLLEFAGAEGEIAGGDLVAEGLADLGDTEGHLLAGGALDIREIDEDALGRLGPQIQLVFRILGHALEGLEHQVEGPDIGEIPLAALRAADILFVDIGLHLLEAPAGGVDPGVLDELVGPVAGLAALAVHQRIGEVTDMAGCHPHLGVHQDGAVEAHIVRALLDKLLPPGPLDIVFQLHAQRTVIPCVGEAAVNIRAGIDEPPVFAQGHDLVHGFFTVVHAGRFLSCQYPLPCREAGICLFSLNRFARLVNAQCAIFRQNRPDFPLSRASGFL